MKTTPRLETLAIGYGIPEGMRVDERDRLYFVDVIGESKGVHRRDPSGRIEKLLDRSIPNGLVLNEQGDGFVCSGRGLIYWDEKTGETRDLFSEWEGRPVIIGDIQAHQGGSIFAGQMLYDCEAHAEVQTGGSLFRIDPDGRVTKLWDDLLVSNGIAFSPDFKNLYHADSPTRAVWVYDVMADLSLSDRRIFCTVPAGFPDGITVDVEGGVLITCAGSGELMRVQPNGTIDWRMEMPFKFVFTATFGGEDMQDLYVAMLDNPPLERPSALKIAGARNGTICRMRADIPGLREPRAKFT